MNVYFDNSATTQPLPEVIKSMVEVSERYYGNPSSLHHLGVEVEHLIKKSKEVISKSLGIGMNEICFTSGGTESNNLAIKGAAFQFQNRGKHLITSEIEHPSVYEVFQVLQKQFGFRVTFLPVNAEGKVSVADLEEAICPDTILVSIMHVNNETGAIQPIEEVGSLLKKYPKILFHVDAVQSVGKIPLDIKGASIDLLSISGHKFHAPKGTGILYVREGLILSPLFHGGGQQQGVRPGTENVPGIVGLAKAIRINAENEKQDQMYLQQLKKRFITGLKESSLSLIINSNENEKGGAPHIVNISLPGLKAEVIVHALEEKGIYVSTKSACSSKKNKPSRVLTAMGLREEYSLSSLRFSFSKHNKIEEIDYCLSVMEEILPYYQNIMKV